MQKQGSVTLWSYRDLIKQLQFPCTLTYHEFNHVLNYLNFSGVPSWIGSTSHFLSKQKAGYFLKRSQTWTLITWIKITLTSTMGAFPIMPSQFFPSHNSDANWHARNNFNSYLPWTIVCSIMFWTTQGYPTFNDSILSETMMLSQNEFHRGNYISAVPPWIESTS